MTGDLAAFHHLERRGLARSSAASRGRTRGWKRHPAGGIEGARHLARQRRSPRADHRGEREGQPRRAPGCTGASGPWRWRLPRRLSTTLPEVHDGDGGAHVAHRRQVVGDEEVGEPELLWRSRSRFRICARIETSRADTGSSSTSSLGERARARAMAMRWRWPPENSWGTATPSAGAARPHPAGRRCASCTSAAVTALVGDERLGDDGAHPHARIQRGEGILEDRLDGAPIGANALGIEAWRSRPSKSSSPPVGLFQPQHQLGGGGLATARLTHDAKRTARSR